MASVDTTAAQSTNGHGSGAEIPVENPATGEVIAHVADTQPDKVAELARLGRAAQPGWQALGFDGRARVLRNLRKWLMTNGDDVVETLVSETGKTYEDANLIELLYAGGALTYWTKHAERFLADERVGVRTLAVAGKKMVMRYEPVGLVGIIGPWNYPLVNSFGDAIPALLAGNSVILKPSEVTPLTSLLMADALADCGIPANVFQVVDGPGRHGRGARRRGRLRHVHGLDGDGQEGPRARRPDADADLPGARRQGPDDRALRRRPRARGERGRLLLDAQRRPDVRLGRARVRRGAGLRRLRRARRDEGPGDPPGRLDRSRDERGRRDDDPRTARHRRAPRRRRGGEGGAGGDGRPARRGRRVVLRADGPRRRRPHDAGDDRGDVRADAADHARRRRRGGAAPRQRLPVRARGVGLRWPRARRGARAPDRGGRGLRQRCAAELPRRRAADGRLEGLGDGLAPRRGRHPQVHQAAVAVHQPRAPTARGVHVPVQGEVLEAPVRGVRALYGRGKRG